MSALLLKICAIILFTLLRFMQGSVNLPNGKLGICRDKDDCPSADVYDGLDCSCEGQVCCVDSGKAKSKCEEYGKFAYVEDYGAALMARRTLQNISQCHIEAVPLIVGGMEAKLMEFPHMAAIGFGDKPDVKYICGASLISPQHILTAAHCSKSQEHGDAKWAKLGLINVKEFDESEQEYLVTDRILHPRYKPPSRYNDIAIFKLEKPVEMTAYVRPACLHTDPEISVPQATATGWGKLAYSDTEGSQNLMKVELSIIRGSECDDTYKSDIGGVAMNRGVIESQFCAGALAGGKDTCQGDSGGPLQTALASPFCMYSVVGVTSFGKFCAFANAPAVYSRVGHYLPWIESILWP